MKKFLKIIMFVTLLNFVNLYAEESDVLGLWMTPGGDHVKVYQESGYYVGDIVKLAEPIYPVGHKLAGKEKIDTENPDATKQGKKVTGMRFLWGFTFKDDKYKEGRIYNPGDGKTYYCKMEIQGTQMKVRGSLDKFGIAGSTQIWKKMK